MKFELPSNPTYPLEVETVGGSRAWIDSDRGPVVGPLLGRLICKDGREAHVRWSESGLYESLNGYDGAYNLKPIHVPVFPDWLPEGCWITKDLDASIELWENRPHTDGLFWRESALKVNNLEHLNYDWTQIFPESWPWEKCCLRIERQTPNNS